MIGDTSIDAAAARNAKVPFVAVSFGYGDGPVESFQPDAVIHSFADLLPVLRRLFAGQNRAAGGAGHEAADGRRQGARDHEVATESQWLAHGHPHQ